MVDFRCTRNAPYTAPSAPGRVDRTARVGYYFNVVSADDALEIMALRFPSDVEEYGSREAAFTVDLG